MSGQGSVHRRHHAERCAKWKLDGKRAGYAKHRCREPWYFSLTLGRDPLTGKRVYVTEGGFRTHEEAEAARDAAREKHRVTGARGQGWTVGSWLDHWLKTLRSAGRSVTTTTRHEVNIRLHLKPLLGDIALKDLEPEHVDALLAAIAAPDYVAANRSGNRYKSGRPGLSSATQNRIFDTLHAALGAAAKRRLIAFNPAGVVEVVAETNSAMGSWTPEQAASFLDHPSVSGSRLYAAWHLVLHSGGRRGELAGAWWHDFDLAEAWWDLTRNRVQIGGEVFEKAPKSKAGTRRVYLDEGTVAVLRAHRKQQVAERLRSVKPWPDYVHVTPGGLPCDCGGPVFVSLRTGEPIKPGSLSELWDRLVETTGLPRIPLHGARHTAVTAATEYAHVSSQTSLERFGHSSEAVQRRYRHVDAELHRLAAERAAQEIARHRKHSSDGDAGRPREADV